MDRAENTVPLLLFNCSLAGRAENTIPLLFAGRCLPTVAAQSPISRSSRSNGFTCHNIVKYFNENSSSCFLYFILITILTDGPLPCREIEKEFSFKFLAK
jgi:hypothetical protein